MLIRISILFEPSFLYCIPDVYGVGDNKLVGTIPSEIGRLSLLEYLNAGKFASFECNIVQADVFFGDSKFYITPLKRTLTEEINLLDGNIPSEIGDLEKLLVLDLGKIF